jgi:hypothetical protein
MIQDKILQIIENLEEMTTSNQLVWTSIPKSNHERLLSATGEDDSKYELEVRFRLDSDEWKLESGPSLWLRNPNLPNGMLYVYGGKYDLTNLRKLVMDRFCSDMNPSTKEVEDVLDSINKGISVSVYRNNKLNKVLNGVK